MVKQLKDCVVLLILNLMRRVLQQVCHPDIPPAIFVSCCNNKDSNSPLNMATSSIYRFSVETNHGINTPSHPVSSDRGSLIWQTSDIQHVQSLPTVQNCAVKRDLRILYKLIHHTKISQFVVLNKVAKSKKVAITYTYTHLIPCLHQLTAMVLVI